MASYDDFFGEPWVLLGRGGDFETGMRILALRPLGTEASQVVGAEDTANVTVSTVRPVPAETPVIPRTVSNLTLRVDVKEWALLVVTSVCKEECVSVYILVDYGAPSNYLCYILYFPRTSKGGSEMVYI